MFVNLGCVNSDNLKYLDVVGDYIGIEGSKNHNHLEVLIDSTYRFEQAEAYSCDLWAFYYGKCNLLNGNLVLFRGVDLESNIQINETKNFYSDSLEIKFSNKFISTFTNLKVRIGLDSFDTDIKNNQINLSKSKHIMRNYHLDSLESDYSFKYDPTKIHLRSDRYFYIYQYAFENDQIEIDILNFQKNDYEDAKLMKYKIKNDKLKSVSYSKEIENHILEIQI